MKPYYDEGGITIYHGDCREIDAWLAADVLVTDPPYGVNWSAQSSGWTNASGGGGHRSSGNARAILNDADTAARDAALAMWGDKPALVFGDILHHKPEGAVHVLVYAKPADAGIMGAKGGRRRDVEGVYMLGKWPVGIGGRTSIIHTNGRVAGPRSMALRAGHPHAKPLDVVGELIAMRDGLVADPFMGSGTTLRAAKDLGRKAIGIEIDERYCEIAAKRLAQEVLDFGPAA